MNDFNIRDAQRLLSQSGELSQTNQNIMRVKEQIEEYINQISNAWQSDTQDKEAYLSGIKSALGKMSTLTVAVNSLATKLNSFAEQSIRVANNG